MIGRWDTNGHERISCADPRGSGYFRGIERKTPPQNALCRPFATHPMAESAEGSCAVIISESACRPRAGTAVHEKRRRGLTRRRKVRRLAGFVIASRRGRLGLALGDERVRQIGELGNGEQVDETEALRGLPLAPLGVDPRKADVVMGDPADLVFPNGHLGNNRPKSRGRDRRPQGECGGLAAAPAPVPTGTSQGNWKMARQHPARWIAGSQSEQQATGGSSPAAPRHHASYPKRRSRGHWCGRTLADGRHGCGAGNRATRSRWVPAPIPGSVLSSLTQI